MTHRSLWSSTFVIDIQEDLSTTQFLRPQDIGGSHGDVLRGNRTQVDPRNSKISAKRFIDSEMIDSVLNLLVVGHTHQSFPIMRLSSPIVNGVEFQADDDVWTNRRKEKMERCRKCLLCNCVITTTTAKFFFIKSSSNKHI